MTKDLYDTIMEAAFQASEAKLAADAAERSYKQLSAAVEDFRANVVQLNGYVERANDLVRKARDLAVSEAKKK